MVRLNILAGFRDALRRILGKDNRNVEYSAYLRSAEWDRRRREVLRRAGYRCQSCGASGVRLDVHHVTYARRGNERHRDLRAVCRSCHKRAHGIED